MSTEENKHLIRRYYHDLWNRWNLALADEIISEGLSFRGSLGVALRGRDARGVEAGGLQADPEEPGPLL